MRGMGERSIGGRGNEGLEGEEKNEGRWEEERVEEGLEKGKGVFSGDRRDEGVRIVFWNVTGLGNKDKEFWRGINEWDVVDVGNMGGGKGMGKIKRQDDEWI